MNIMNRTYKYAGKPLTKIMFQRRNISYVGNMNEYRDRAVSMKWKASWAWSEIAHQLFTILGVSFITSVDIYLFPIRKPKSGTKRIGI